MAATEVLIADGPNLDAFGRLRVSNSIILFDSQLTYDQQPLLWDTVLAAGGSSTYQSDEAANLLAVDITPNASVIRQSKAYHRYRPGHSSKIIMTFNLKQPIQNVTKRVGYFDANDGIFIKQSGDGSISLVRRTSVSGVPLDNEVPQASWNLDRMDGSGISGFTLNWTLAQNMQIDLQALYVGRVRVGFSLGGVMRYVHEFNSSNVLQVPYIRTANLPVRYEIVATGAAAQAAELLEICSSVVAEGGPPEERGFEFSADTGLAPRTVGATVLPVIAIRPAALFKGRANHGQMILEGIDFLASTGTDEVHWQLIYNPAVTGGAWAAVNAESIAEVNITGTAIVGGIVIDSGFIWAAAGTRIASQIEEEHLKYPWVQDVTTQIPMALCFRDASGSSNMVASMNWRELR